MTFSEAAWKNHVSIAPARRGDGRDEPGHDERRDLRSGRSNGKSWWTFLRLTLWWCSLPERIEFAAEGVMAALGRLQDKPHRLTPPV